MGLAKRITLPLKKKNQQQTGKVRGKKNEKKAPISKRGGGPAAKNTKNKVNKEKKKNILFWRRGQP